MATKWAIDPDSHLWIVRSSPSWAIDTGDGACCCCLTYDQALLSDAIVGVWSGVAFDFSCEGFSGGGSVKLLTAGLNASWSIPKVSTSSGVITFQLASSSIGTLSAYSPSNTCNPIQFLSTGGGVITVILHDTGAWSVDVGVGSTSPSGRLFRASGDTCLPTDVLNEIVAFGFNFLGTFADVGRFGDVSFSFA
jgi:hypothetical protein